MDRENIYETTLNKEVIREVSAGILSDLDRYIEEKQIKEDSNDLILGIRKKVLYIYKNIYGNKIYNSMNDILEIKGQLKMINELLMDIGVNI